MEKLRTVIIGKRIYTITFDPQGYQKVYEQSFPALQESLKELAKARQVPDKIWDYQLRC